MISRSIHRMACACTCLLATATTVPPVRGAPACTPCAGRARPTGASGAPRRHRHPSVGQKPPVDSIVVLVLSCCCCGSEAVVCSCCCCCACDCWYRSARRVASSRQRCCTVLLLLPYHPSWRLAAPRLLSNPTRGQNVCLETLSASYMCRINQDCVFLLNFQPASLSLLAQRVKYAAACAGSLTDDGLVRCLRCFSTCCYWSLLLPVWVVLRLLVPPHSSSSGGCRSSNNVLADLSCASCPFSWRSCFAVLGSPPQEPQPQDPLLLAVHRQRPSCSWTCGCKREGSRQAGTLARQVKHSYNRRRP